MIFLRPIVTLNTLREFRVDKNCQLGNNSHPAKAKAQARKAAWVNWAFN